MFISKDSEIYALLCALTKYFDNYETPLRTAIRCWKHKVDEYYFIVGITIPQFEVGKFKYITYDVPISWWNRFKLMEIEEIPIIGNEDVVKLLLEL